MDPNANQPGVGQPSGQQPGRQLPPNEWAYAAPVDPIPDWQQGLGTPLQRAPLLPPDPAAPQLPLVSQENPFPQLPPAPQGPPPLAPDAEYEYEARATNGKRRSLAMWFVAALVVILVLSVGGFLLIQDRSKSKPQTASDAGMHSTAGTPKKTVSLATLSSVNFGLPVDLNPFRGDSGTDANYHVYLTQESTDTTACSLEFGTVSAGQLAGNDLETILGAQIDAIKKDGATVAGPAAGPALVLKNAASSATYSMPTRNYEFSKDNNHGTVHYSLVVLKNGTRVVVSRQCANANGPTDPAILAKLDAAAKQLTINTAKQ